MNDKILVYKIPEVFCGITLRGADLSYLKERHPNISLAEQVHGSDVAIVDDNDQDFIADAQLTQVKDIMLVVKTADCLPVLIYDPVKKIVGTVHSGRKGTMDSILYKTLKVMSVVYGSIMNDVILHFGPHITKNYYQIAPGVVFDIFDHNYQQARKMGVNDQNIINSGFCSHQDNDKFYSYRKEDQTNLRNYSFIKLL